MGEQAGLDWYRMGEKRMRAELGTSVKGDPLSGLDKITEALRARQKAKEEETKAIEKEKKTARDEFGQKLNNDFVELGPQLKSLGQDSYNQAQMEVEALRNEMYEAINNDDVKVQADINVRLNELKMRHAADAENLTSFIDSYENELVSTDAMTSEHQDVHKNFATNPTKRVIYSNTNPPKLMYEWDVPVVDDDPESETYGKQMIDANGDPMTEPKSYSLEELNDMIVLKDNENGVKVMDYVEEQKKIMAEGGRGPDNRAIKKQMREMIPRDPKQLRDWTYGNPAGADGLDIFEYLMDHPMLDLSQAQYKMLGVEDIAEPAGIGPEDLVDENDKKSMIDKIMNVEDVDITHSVISDIYATISANNIRGREELNPNYNPEEDKLHGVASQEDVIKQKQDKRRAFYDALKEDDFSAVQNMTLQEIKDTYELTDSEIKDGIQIDGKFYNIDSFIQGATKTTGGASAFNKPN